MDGGRNKSHRSNQGREKKQPTRGRRQRREKPVRASLPPFLPLSPACFFLSSQARKEADKMEGGTKVGASRQSSSRRKSRTKKTARGNLGSVFMRWVGIAMYSHLWQAGGYLTRRSCHHFLAANPTKSSGSRGTHSRSGCTVSCTHI